MQSRLTAEVAARRANYRNEIRFDGCCTNEIVVMCHTSCFVKRVPDRTSSTAATNLIAGTVTKYIVLGLSIGLGAVLMPFTVGHLGKTEYGLWMLVASMTAYFQLL